MNQITRAQKISNFLFLVLGILIILLPSFFAKASLCFFILMMGISALKFLIDGFRLHRSLDLLASLILILPIAVGLFSYEYGYHFLIDALGIYLVACALVFLIQMVLDLKSNCADWKAELMMGILYLLNGGLAIYLSGDHLILESRLIGCYLLLQAIQGFMEMFFFSNPYNARYYAFRNWMALPAFIVGILPALYYDHLLRQRLDDKNPVLHLQKSSDQNPPDLSVFIHSGTYGARLYGHMTFSRNHVAYSYGNYDVSAEKWFHTIGSGIFFTAGSEIYSNNCSVVEHSPQFEFGIRLSEAQKKKFDNMVSGILNSTVPWKCPLEEIPMDQVDLKFKDYEKDYASRLWYRTGAEFRKYEDGEWAWYSLLGNNCSNFACAKLNEISLNIPVSKGIVSPGEFFEYFEEAYQDPDSNVISMTLHSAKFPESLFNTID